MINMIYDSKGLNIYGLIETDLLSFCGGAEKVIFKYLKISIFKNFIILV